MTTSPPLSSAHAPALELPPQPLRPKHLPPRLPSAPPDLVPARMINETLYCERLVYLEWVQGEFQDNFFTVEGRSVHRRADQPSGKMPPKAKPKDPAEDDDESANPEAPPYTARSVWLSSDSLGITAKIDIVEGSDDGVVIPIEYKRGSPPEVAEGAYLPERAQLCAQVLLLREHGYRCNQAEIYFAAARRRVPILIDEHLEATTLAAAARAKELTQSGEIPKPLVDSPKCHGCSLVGICLPDETNLLGEAPEDPPEAEAEPERELDPDLEAPLDPDPWGLCGTEPPPRVMRRLHPARDDKVPLLVQERGAYIGLDGDCVVVRTRAGVKHEAKLPKLSQVAVFGNVQISTPAMQALFQRGIQISFFSYGGWYYGRAWGLSSKNVELRLAQYQAALDQRRCLELAKGLVVGKIKNCRTMLRRNHTSLDPVVLGELDGLARKAKEAASLEQLLGLEGTAARYYFQSFTGMLRGSAVEDGFDMEGRNRRPPRDPINALLSFGYALLTKDFTRTLEAVGLDPMLGFYHQPRFGRPALALDLMEEFRPLVADSVVIGVVNTGAIGGDDFVRGPGAVALSPAGRKSFLQAYERRMDQLVTHPVFGYRISYRRVLEVQARLLSRVLLGELEEYPSFRTR